MSGTASPRATTWIRWRSFTCGVEHHQVRGCRRQGRQADRLRPGAGGDRLELRRRGRRRHAAAAPVPVAEAAVRAAPARAVRGTRAAAGRQCCWKWSSAACCSTRALLRKQSGELGAKLLELQKQAHEAAGGEFNVDSPKQLQQILFEKLQLPVMRKTPTGQPSTGEDVLEELAVDYKLPRLILEYRGLAKLKSTYTDKLPDESRRDARSACIPATTRQSRPPGGCRPPIRTCRTFRSARRKAVASARPSSRRPDRC